LKALEQWRLLVASGIDRRYLTWVSASRRERCKSVFVLGGMMLPSRHVRDGCNGIAWVMVPRTVLLPCLFCLDKTSNDGIMWRD
jgi:hypothetical protein